MNETTEISPQPTGAPQRIRRRHRFMAGLLGMLALAGITVSSQAVTATRAEATTLSGTAVLRAGTNIVSPNGCYRLAMQSDGQLALYFGPNWPFSTGTAIWWSNTAGNPGAYLRMQSDGNVVVVTPDGRRALWHAGTWGNPGAYLKLQDDGNLIVASADSRVALWASGTAGGALANRIVQIARQELAKNPAEIAGNNIVRYENGRGALAPYNTGRSWCADFASWVVRTAGSSMPWMSHCGAGSAAEIQGWAEANGKYRPLSAGARVGDLMLFGRPGACGHVTIVVEVRADGAVRTIGGNEDNRVSFRDWRQPSSAGAYGFVTL